jgi:hypothetical protein
MNDAFGELISTVDTLWKNKLESRSIKYSQNDTEGMKSKEKQDKLQKL